jgi:hypothetical protein
MKKMITLLLACIFAAATIKAQVPQKINYQGIARTNGGAALRDKALGIRLSILQGSANGAAQYVETHSVTTNAYGLYNVAIGGGTAVSGTMAGVTWGNGDKFIKVEMDANGGSNYTASATSQLLSVPYALFSASGLPGPQGPAGPQGPVGPQGLQGLPGTGTVNTIQGDAAIGVTNPSGPTVGLALNNNSINTIKLAQSGAAIGQVIKWNGGQWGPANESPGSWTVAGNNIYNNNTGNVGIGTSQPTDKLHVAGDFRVVGNASISGTVFSDATNTNFITTASLTSINGNPINISSANFLGNITVNNGKGIVYNAANSTSLKVFTFTTATFGAVLPGFGLSAEGSIAFNGGFTGTPSVFVGDIETTSGVAGELYRVQLQLYGCSTTGGITTCRARLLNTSPNPVSYNITWNCMAIGN